MALGFDTGFVQTALPLVKFDGRTGRFLRIDRQDQRRDYVDISACFRALFDMEGIEVGWMLFSHGSAPDMRLFPVGAPWTPAPSPLYRRGVRLTMQLDPCAGGGLREMCSTATNFLRAFDSLHDEWLACRGENPGHLPVVSLANPPPAGEDAPLRVNPEPEFVITGWSRRPAALSLTA